VISESALVGTFDDEVMGQGWRHVRQEQDIGGWSARLHRRASGSDDDLEIRHAAKASASIRPCPSSLMLNSRIREGEAHSAADMDGFRARATCDRQRS
jgi:hypothetical protein